MRKLLLVKRSLQLKYLAIVSVSTLASAMAGCLGARTGSTFWVLVVLISVIGLESILILSRFLGPVYGIEKSLKLLSSGDLTVNFHYRQGDEMADMVNAANDMVASFHHRIHNDRKTVLEAMNDLDKIVTQLQQHAHGVATSQEIFNHLSSVKTKISHVTAGFKL